MERMVANTDAKQEKLDVMELIYERARTADATIGLADTMSDDGSPDPRVEQAVKSIEEKKLARAELITPDYFSRLTADIQRQLVDTVIEARAARGKPVSEEDARGWLTSDPKYVAAAMVRTGMLDGYVAGNVSTTESTLRPALQIIGTSEGYASSFFIMLFPDGSPIFFADCGFNYNPNSEELAKIAIDTARNVENLGIEPKIAFLSFSTEGSATHEHVKKVQDAIALARERAPKLAIGERELQLDAALRPDVGARKAPGSSIAGKANVLIFPDLDSGNIAYKMANFLGVRAIGPLMQGLNKPANDLSRGCTAEDIRDAVAVTAMQAGALKRAE